jgi:uncharacterized membrane protein
VNRASINGGTTSPDLSQPAVLIGLPLINIGGRTVTNIGATTQTLTFTEADIANHTTRTVSSGNVAQSLTGSLLGNLSLNLNGFGLTPLLQTSLAATLSLAAAPLDLVLDQVLRSLGVRIGYADVEMDGTLCSQAVLVQ